VHQARGLAVILIVILAAACSSSATSEDEAGTCPVRPKTDCHNQDLRNASFVDGQLAGANLSGADLSKADMRGVDLTGANLEGAQLGGTDFTGATLKDANLAGSFMFGTNLTDADLTGADQTGTQRCNVVEPDGAITLGGLIGPDGTLVPCGVTTAPTAPPAAPRPPSVAYFRLTKPARCLNDASGTGIEVEWSTPNANALTFLVDGVRIDAATKAHGTKRLPFNCDRKVHMVSVQAYGSAVAPATSAFAVSLNPVSPLTANG
jgi:Pentapeptide repeats (8 copies)